MSDEGHRDTVETAVKPEGQVKLGSLLAEIGREVKLTAEEFEVFENVRDRSPTRAAGFNVQN
jgi:plasmid stability protein